MSEDLSAAVREAQIRQGVPAVDAVPADEKAASFDRNKVGMGIALNDRVIYAGTVPAHVKAKRRKVGKRQRVARKLHRGNQAAGQ